MDEKGVLLYFCLIGFMVVSGRRGWEEGIVEHLLM